MANSFLFNKIERTDFANFNCHLWKGKPVGKHSHEDYYEILITLDDYFETVDGETFLRKQKDVTILRPNVSHSINNLDENSCHYNIAVRKKYFESFIENKTALKSYFTKNNYLSFTLDNETYSYVNNITAKLDNQKYDYLSLTLIESVLYAIVSCALPLLICKEESSDKILDLIKDAVAKINNGTLIEKSPKDLYALYPLSHTTFIKAFKKLTDKTPSEYLTDKKLEYAKNLLLTTNDSVLDISLKIGFESVSHFIRIFKMKYGITPLQLRKEDIKNNNPNLVKTD